MSIKFWLVLGVCSTVPYKCGCCKNYELKRHGDYGLVDEYFILIDSYHPLGSFMVDMAISSNIMKSPSPKCYMTFWDMTYTMTPSIDQTLHQFANLLPNWTLIPNWPYYRILEVSIEHCNGCASQQRTLTPPDTWSCPIWDLHLF